MKAVCLLSGGMDSTTLAYVAKDRGYDILALHVNYGQRTEQKERQCARNIANLLDAEDFVEISLDYFKKFGSSSLTDHAIAVDPHNDHQEGLPKTYVPFRNANLLAIATSYAEARGASAIFIGVQAGDYAGYPDCRPEFVEAFQRVITLGTNPESNITLVTPFVNMNKTEILKVGFSLGVPYEQTWSCYQSEDAACGICDSCYYRKKAFLEAGIPDPILYAGA